VLEAYLQAWMAIAARLLEGAPVGVASTSASLRAAIRAGAPTPTAIRQFPAGPRRDVVRGRV